MSPFVTDYPAALLSLHVYTHEHLIDIEILQTGSHLPKGRKLFALLRTPLRSCVANLGGNIGACLLHTVWSACQAGRNLYHHRHHVVWLTTGPFPPPERIIYRVIPNSSPFSFQYLLLLLSSSSSCLPLFRLLLVLSIFSSTRWFIRQFLRMMRLIQLAFFFLLSAWQEEGTNQLRAVKPLIKERRPSSSTIGIEITAIRHRHLING